ncbi:MAG: DUF86 domain-containing protein [Candidatus Nanohaloarchaea archaeon]|nr:DUF86 domain-containing protein [Candidatus Nanohaloarchaea archaeon]
MTTIDERLDLIQESVSRLRGVEVEEDDFYRYQGIKHTLQEAVEAAIDAASHIIAEEGFGRQDDYADYFATLEDSGVIDAELSENLQQMARFRNLVVHRYTELDPEELQEIIDNNLDDLLRFVEAVEDYRAETREQAESERS